MCQLLNGYLIPQSGLIQWHVPFIYLDQHTTCLNAKLTLIDNFFKLQPQANLQQAHQLLAHFLFKNMQANKYVKDLSGGERLRAALACLLYGDAPPLCLILDEPNNHLDISSLMILEKTLANYSGALIVISHDDYFLKQIHCEYQLNTPLKYETELIPFVKE